MNEQHHQKLKDKFGSAGEALKVTVEFFIRLLEEVGDPELTKLWIKAFNERAVKLLKKQEDADE